MTSEKGAKAKEAISLSTVLDSAKDQCLALKIQLEEDKLMYDKVSEATSLKLNAKETIEAELRTEREKLNSSIATLAKELDESKRKGDANSVRIMYITRGRPTLTLLPKQQRLRIYNRS